MKKILLLFTIIISINCFSQSKTEKVIQLLKLMHPEATMKASMVQMVKQMQKNGIANSKLTPLDIIKIVNDIDYSGLTNNMVSLYEKSFTEEEIIEFIKFYSEPYGKKLVEKSLDMQLEFMDINQDLAKQFAFKLLQKIKKSSN